MMNGVLSRLLAAGILVMSLTSCATVRGWMGSGKQQGKTPVVSSMEGPIDPEDAKRALETVVEAHVASANNSSENARGRIQREKPYYFKEYVEYPKGAADQITPTLQETESRTAPYRAEVELPKIRYATRLHRSRDAARNDTLFFRQTGTETLSYALRNGSWKLLGSVFVAEKTETYAGGTWTETLPDHIPVDVESESSKGWFGRQWSRWFGK